MKVKTSNNDNIYESIRYNKNTLGTHLQIQKGTFKSEKRDYCALCLLSLIKDKNNIKNDEDIINFISEMSQNALEFINKYNDSENKMVL